MLHSCFSGLVCTATSIFIVTSSPEKLPHNAKDPNLTLRHGCSPPDANPVFLYHRDIVIFIIIIIIININVIIIIVVVVITIITIIIVVFVVVMVVVIVIITYICELRDLGLNRQISGLEKS